MTNQLTPLLELEETPTDPESLSGSFTDRGDPTASKPSSLARASKTKSSTTAPNPDVYETHFSLRIPTSTVHFRGSVLHVIDTDRDQIVLQENDVKEKDDDGNQNSSRKILVKRMSPGTYGQQVLRIGYSLITILFCGFLFVFCFQVILFLFIALPVYSGYTSQTKTADPLSLISTLLSFPVMVYGMTSLMALGSAFVNDTWHGGKLFGNKVIEGVYIAIFVVVPIFTFMVALMAQSPEPWRVTAAVWAVLVAVLFCMFGLAVTERQVSACFMLVQKHFPVEDSEEEHKEEQEGNVLRGKWNHFFKVAKQALLLTQTARYSGNRRERYHVAELDDADGTMLDGFSASPLFEPVETNTGLYTRLTSFEFCSTKLRMFDKLDRPKRIYLSEEVREILPFMTKNNWSMQKMWCAGESRHRNVIVARGPSAMTTEQMQYAIFCTITSVVLVTLLMIGGLVWMAAGAGSYVVVALISLICCIWPLIRNSSEMYKMYQGVHEDAMRGEGEEEDGQGNLFQVWETVRVTQPRPWYCYLNVFSEAFFLFLWPFIAMLVEGNYPVALVFVLLASFTFIWRYFDASSILAEIGPMSAADDGSLTHLQKYRISEITGRVVNNKGRRIWTYIFIICFLMLFLLFISAQGESDSVNPDDRGARPPILLLDDFYYPAKEDTLAYPTCKLSKGFEFPGIGYSHLGDYSFLSAMAYEKYNVTSVVLSEWFGGPNRVIDEDGFVSEYRIDSGTSGSPVYFKLFSFPSAPGYGVMSIRGSETSYDWIVNLQLWSAAGLAQVVKWLTPFGWIWSSILPDLIYWVNLVESKAISDVAYYKVTTRFANDVLAGYGGSEFSNLHVTGASLGGGLAIITGAQTAAYTVAISGPGAVLSRKTYDPPITVDKLDSHTFNFIPERDYIAMLGGRAQLYQNAECTAASNNLFGCHSMWRSVCEIQYKCGSNGRPVVCRCVSQFGYPEPVQNGTRSFTEACQEAEAEWCSQFPC